MAHFSITFFPPEVCILFNISFKNMFEYIMITRSNAYRFLIFSYELEVGCCYKVVILSKTLLYMKEYAGVHVQNDPGHFYTQNELDWLRGKVAAFFLFFI